MPSAWIIARILHLLRREAGAARGRGRRASVRLRHLRPPVERVRLSVATPAARAMMFSWVIGLPPGPPTSPSMCPSRMTSTRSQVPMISGSSLEITITPMPFFARSSMIR